MPIPMEIPTEFLLRNAIRYGCILKDPVTGQIVGHLKEVGQAGNLLAQLPLGPLTTVTQVGQWIDTHSQLRAIRQTLDHLQMISTVGALASVAGLGVSIAGFALVLRHLNRLEHGLNQALKRLEQKVQTIIRHQEMLATAELLTAWEQLQQAQQTGPGQRAAQLLHHADTVVHKYRNFYFTLIMQMRPLHSADLSSEEARELYARFLACAVAKLEADLLLGGPRDWECRYRMIVTQVRDVCDVNIREVFQARADAAKGLLTDEERKKLLAEAKFTGEMCQESKLRIETAEAEVKWLERQSMSGWDYLRELKAAPEEGLILIPHASKK